MVVRAPHEAASSQWRFPGLSAEDHRPLYIQIAESIRAGIESGHFRQGERLPGAHLIARRYAVTGETVEHALSVLAEAGWVRSVKRVGTFVCKVREAPMSARDPQVMSGAQTYPPTRCECGHERSLHVFVEGRKAGVWGPCQRTDCGCLGYVEAADG